MKRIITKMTVVFLVLTMCISMSGCKKGNNDTPAGDSAATPVTEPAAIVTTAPATTPTTAPATTPASEPTTTPVVDGDGSKEADIVPLSLYRLNEDLKYLGTENVSDKAVASFEYFVMTDRDATRYKALNDALANSIIGTRNMVYEELVSTWQYACEDIKNGRVLENPYCYEVTSSVNRADSSVLSIINEAYSYIGGVHPGYSYGVLNLDAETGNNIELGDVLKSIATDNNCEKIVEAVREQVTGLERGVDFDFDAFATALLEGRVAFSVDYQGISFFVDPYVAASYAAGSFRLSISYAKYPELFTGKYMAAPKSFMVMNSDGFKADINNDGEYENVDVAVISEAYDEISEIRLAFTVYGNDYNKRVESEYKTFGFAANLEDTIVMAEVDGSFFILAEVISENGHCDLIVLKFNGYELVPVSELPMLVSQPDYCEDMTMACVVNPSDFCGITGHALFGTCYERAFYRLNTDGRIERLDPYYSIMKYDIVARKAFEAVTVSEDGATGETISIPAGTELIIYRADGYGAVDFKIEGENDKMYRINLTTTTTDGRSESFFAFFNNEPITDVFEGVDFAG